MFFFSSYFNHKISSSIISKFIFITNKKYSKQTIKIYCTRGDESSILEYLRAIKKEFFEPDAKNTAKQHKNVFVTCKKIIIIILE